MIRMGKTIVSILEINPLVLVNRLIFSPTFTVRNHILPNQPLLFLLSPRNFIAFIVCVAYLTLGAGDLLLVQHSCTLFIRHSRGDRDVPSSVCHNTEEP